MLHPIQSFNAAEQSHRSMVNASLVLSTVAMVSAIALNVIVLIVILA